MVLKIIDKNIKKDETLQCITEDEKMFPDDAITCSSLRHEVYLYLFSDSRY